MHNMRLEDALAFLLGGRTKVRILEVLLLHPQQSFHLRGLATAAGTDAGNTSRILRGLVDTGLVLGVPDSHSMRYSINDRSPLTQPLRQLIVCAGSLLNDLREAASTLAEAEYVGVFGSVANGSDDMSSDVDVLVIGSLGAVAAQAAFKAVGRKHRRTVNAVAVSSEGLASHLVGGDAFWASIARGPRIDLRAMWPHDGASISAIACAPAP